MMIRTALLIGVLSAGPATAQDEVSAPADEPRAAAAAAAAAPGATVPPPPPGVTAEPAASAEDLAFLDAIASMPGGALKPTQIREIKQDYRERLREEVPNDPPSKAVSTILSASFTPATPAPSVTLYHGYVTAIDLVDSTGQPWPAYSPTVGDTQAVQIEGQLKEEKLDSASIMLKPGIRYANTNLILPLRGAPRPITVLLRNDDPKPGEAVYDRITIIIDGRGPNAAAVPMARRVRPQDDLRAVLLGEAPSKGAYRGHVDYDRTTAWIDGKTMWVRTENELISPAPEAELQLGDLRAYRVAALPRIVVRTTAGTMETIAVQEVPSNDH